MPAKASRAQRKKRDSQRDVAHTTNDSMMQPTNSSSKSFSEADSCSESFSETASECDSEASTRILQADEQGDADRLIVGQRFLISSSVKAERLRGRVGVVIKVPKRGTNYTVSVAGQKFKSPREYIEPAPSGPELKQLASDVLYDWLPATGGWHPHEDCKDELLLDFIDGVRACQLGEQPEALNPKLGSRLCAIQESEEAEPTATMAGMMAGAFLDLPNPLCNPWQRDLIWPFADPNAKIKYRTPLQKIMDCLAAQTGGYVNKAASSCEPMRVEDLEEKAAAITRVTLASPEPHCVVCLAESDERKIDWIFKECGHCCLCKPCVRKLHDQAASDIVECPLCRTASTIVPSRCYTGRIFYAE